jgi:hypothetical protein
MPKKPSLQARRLEPNPKIKRPPLIRSRSIAAIAVSKRLRTKASAIPEARSKRVVVVAAAARGMKGGP